MSLYIYIFHPTAAIQVRTYMPSVYEDKSCFTIVGVATILTDDNKMTGNREKAVSCEDTEWMSWGHGVRGVYISEDLAGQVRNQELLKTIYI